MVSFKIDRPTQLGLNCIAWFIAIVAIFHCAAISFADPYFWATTLAGDPPATYSDNVARNFTWQWTTGQEYVTGTASILRVGAGLTYSGSGYDNSFANGGEFDPTSLSLSYGGVYAEYAFTSDGQLFSGTGAGSPIQDVSDTNPSTTSFSFKFDPGYSSPRNTLLNLFDPGAYTASVNGPFTFAISAFLGNAAVDLTLWKLEIEDPYMPSRSAAGLFTWDSQSGMLIYPHDDTNPLYPSWMVYFDTGPTTFDTVSLVANGIAVDSMGFGIGANTPAVPEPRSIVICLAGVLGISLNQFGARKSLIC